MTGVCLLEVLCWLVSSGCVSAAASRPWVGAVLLSGALFCGVRHSSHILHMVGGHSGVSVALAGLYCCWWCCDHINQSGFAAGRAVGVMQRMQFTSFPAVSPQTL